MQHLIDEWDLTDPEGGGLSLCGRKLPRAAFLSHGFPETVRICEDCINLFEDATDVGI